MVRYCVRSFSIAALLLTVATASAKRRMPLKHEPAPEKFAPPPKIETSLLNAVVEKNKIAMKVCYQRVLRRDADVRVKVIAKLKILQTGSVSEVAFADPQLYKEEIGACLSEAFRRWEFPVWKLDYEFEFPVVLVKD
jgi:hypothetical protein